MYGTEHVETKLYIDIEVYIMKVLHWILYVAVYLSVRFY